MGTYYSLTPEIFITWTALLLLDHCVKENFLWKVKIKHLEMFCIFKCSSFPILLPFFVFLQNCSSLKTAFTSLSY